MTAKEIDVRGDQKHLGKSVKVIHEQATNRKPPHLGQQSVSRQSLAQVRDMLLKQVEHEVNGQRALRLTQRSVGKARPEAAYVRFQDKLRTIGATEKGINEVVALLGESSDVLCRRPNGLATLKWLGKEFARNLLTEIHNSDKKNPTTEAEVSNFFKAAALRLRTTQGKLTKEGLDHLMEGFDEGMKRPNEPGNAAKDTSYVNRDGQRHHAPNKTVSESRARQESVNTAATQNRRVDSNPRASDQTQIRTLEQRLERTIRSLDDARSEQVRLQKQRDAGGNPSHPTELRANNHDATTQQINALAEKVARLEMRLAELTRLLRERQADGADHKHGGDLGKEDHIGPLSNFGKKTLVVEPDTGSADQPAPLDPASVKLALADTKNRLADLARSIEQEQQRLAADPPAPVDPASVNLALADTKNRLADLARSIEQEQQRLAADRPEPIESASVNLALADTKNRLADLARSIEQEQQRLAADQPEPIDPDSVNLALADTKNRLAGLARSIEQEQRRLAADQPAPVDPASVSLALADTKNRLADLARSIEQEQQRLAADQPAPVDPTSVNLALADTKNRLAGLARSIEQEQQRLAADQPAPVDPTSVNLALADTKNRLAGLARSIEQEQRRLAADQPEPIDPASVNLALADTKNRLEDLARSIEQEQRRLAAADPAIERFDPSMAARVNPAPQHGEQLQSVMNEPSQVAPLTETNEIDPNAVPGEHALGTSNIATGTPIATLRTAGFGSPGHEKHDTPEDPLVFLSAEEIANALRREPSDGTASDRSQDGDNTARDRRDDITGTESSLSQPFVPGRLSGRETEERVDVEALKQAFWDSVNATDIEQAQRSALTFVADWTGGRDSLQAMRSGLADLNGKEMTRRTYRKGALRSEWQDKAFEQALSDFDATAARTMYRAAFGAVPPQRRLTFVETLIQLGTSRSTDIDFNFAAHMEANNFLAELAHYAKDRSDQGDMTWTSILENARRSPSDSKSSPVPPPINLRQVLPTAPSLERAAAELGHRFIGGIEEVMSNPAQWNTAETMQISLSYLSQAVKDLEGSRDDRLASDLRQLRATQRDHQDAGNGLKSLNNLFTQSLAKTLVDRADPDWSEAFVNAVFSARENAHSGPGADDVAFRTMDAIVTALREAAHDDGYSNEALKLSYLDAERRARSPAQAGHPSQARPSAREEADLIAQRWSDAIASIPSTEHLQRADAIWSALQALTPETPAPDALDQAPSNPFLRERVISRLAGLVSVEVANQLIDWIDTLSAAQVHEGLATLVSDLVEQQARQSGNTSRDSTFGKLARLAATKAIARIKEVEQAEEAADLAAAPARILAPHLSPVSPGVEPKAHAAQEPAPDDAQAQASTDRKSARESGAIPSQFQQIDTIGAELAQRLKSLPSDAEQWPSHMERIFHGIKVLRVDPQRGVSPQAAGRRLGEALGLSRSSSTVEPGRLEGPLQRVLEGAVQFAQSQDDLEGFMRGLLDVAGGGFATSIAAAAATVTQQAEGGPVRRRAGWLVDFLMLRSDPGIVAEMRQHAQDNSLIAGAVQLIDTEGADRLASSSTTRSLHLASRISDAARQDPTLLLDEVIDASAEDLWAERLSLVQAALADGSAPGAWQAIGTGLAEKLSLNRDLTGWQASAERASRSGNLAPALKAVLEQVASGDDMVALLEGLTRMVTPGVMSWFAQEALQVTATSKPQHKALQAAGVMFQQLHDELAKDLEKQGTSAQRAATKIERDIVTMLDKELEATENPLIVDQARVGFSRRYASQRQDDKR